MKTPYQVHADLTAQAQAFLGGQPSAGNRLLGATLTIIGQTIACTHSPILRDWILQDGKSPTTIVEACEFLLTDLPDTVPNSNPAISTARYLDKGVPCSLQINPNLPGIAFQLWTGGLQAGGLIFRFMLVSANFHG